MPWTEQYGWVEDEQIAPEEGRHTLTPEEQRRGALKGASKGGIARAAKLDPARRREIAQKALAARWKK